MFDFEQVNIEKLESEVSFGSRRKKKRRKRRTNSVPNLPNGGMPSSSNTAAAKRRQAEYERTRQLAVTQRAAEREAARLCRQRKGTAVCSPNNNPLDLNKNGKVSDELSAAAGVTGGMVLVATPEPGTTAAGGLLIAASIGTYAGI